MDTWRSDVFFFVGEAATSKWTHGEVAVFGSTVYKIFALKSRKLRTPLAPCVMNVNLLPAKGWKQTQERCPLKAPSSSKRGQWNYLPSIWINYLHNLKAAKNGHTEKWCVFFRRWGRDLEMDTWRSGRFWFYMYTKFSRLNAKGCALRSLRSLRP